MKKYIICLITVLMVLGLCGGCSKDDGTVNTNSTNNNSLIVEDGMIKYSSNGKLEDVISLEELISGNNNISSIDAKEIELFIEDGYIVWNYIGETSSHRLISINDLQGKQGNTGLQGPKGDTGAKGDTGTSGKDGTDGKDGTNAYIWVKYLNINPEDITEDDEVTLMDEASDYMGIYYGTSALAPLDYHEYTWYNIKGQKGDKGDQGEQGVQGIQGIQGEKGDAGKDGIDGIDGTNAYVYIKYLTNDPSNSNASDMSDTPDNYMGVYSGTSATAPTTISSYKWFKIKGETGEKGDTGATGVQGPQGIQGEKGDKGDQGDSAIAYKSYFDNLAVVTCPFYYKAGNDTQISQKSCSLEYKGKNIDIEIKSDQSSTYLATIGEGTYMFELETNISYEPSETNADTCFISQLIGFPGLNDWTNPREFDKNLKNTTFYSVAERTIDSQMNLIWGFISMTDIDSINGTSMLKIHKIK